MGTDYHMWARTSLDTAETIAHEGEYAIEDFDLDDINDPADAVTAMRAAQVQLDAAKTVADLAKVRVGQLLGVGGAVRIGDDVWRYTRKRSETCIDPDGANEYLTGLVRDGDLRVADLVNVQYAKRSMLPPAVRDTFYRWDEAEEPTVVSVDIDRAPKFLQTLGDGEVRSDAV